jgi:hypothetical protein
VFEKLEVYVLGPINPPTRILRARYIITMKEYLKRWA